MGLRHFTSFKIRFTIKELPFHPKYATEILPALDSGSQLKNPPPSSDLLWATDLLRRLRCTSDGDRLVSYVDYTTLITMRVIFE